MLRLPLPHDQHQAREYAELQRADQENFKKNSEIIVTNDCRLILQSPSGDWWEVHVTDAGVLSTSSTTLP